MIFTDTRTKSLFCDMACPLIDAAIIILHETWEKKTSS